MLQTHVNSLLADCYNQDRVKQARSYLRSIFDEAVGSVYGMLAKAAPKN